MWGEGVWKQPAVDNARSIPMVHTREDNLILTPGWWRMRSEGVTWRRLALGKRLTGRRPANAVAPVRQRLGFPGRNALAEIHWYGVRPLSQFAIDHHQALGVAVDQAELVDDFVVVFFLFDLLGYIPL